MLGSLPTAYLAGRISQRADIRTLGSSNVGAINAYRQYGKAMGLLVLLVDAGKGALAVWVGYLLDMPNITLYLMALAATLGHNFTPFLHFRGGKGAATIFGISIVMLWQITLVTVAIGGLALAATRRPVLALAVMFAVLNGLTIATFQSAGQIALCLGLSFLVIGTHIIRKYPNLPSAVRQGEWRRIFDIGGL